MGIDYIVSDPQSAEKIKQIHKYIQRLQSGGTIDSLKTLGVDTRRQVGASFVSLKTLASHFEADEKIATLLWYSQRREEQILACFLFPQDVNKEKITQLMERCISQEIAEYFGAIFLSRNPLLPEIAEEWIGSKIPFLQTAILCGMARHLIINKKEPMFTQEYFRNLTDRTYENKYVQLVAERYTQHCK